MGSTYPGFVTYQQMAGNRDIPVIGFKAAAGIPGMADPIAAPDATAERSVLVAPHGCCVGR